MTPLQQTRRIVAAILAAHWPTGTQARVFQTHGVLVAPAIAGEDLPETIPIALLNVGQMTSDEKDPRVVIQEWTLALATRLEGDRSGQNAVLGGPRSAGEGDSAGRGILELEPQILGAVRGLTSADGTPVQVRLVTGAGVVQLGDDDMVTQRQYALRSVCTLLEEWPAPQRLTATVDGSDVDLAWHLPEAIGGFTGLVLRRASGSTAPASPSAGDPVTLANALTDTAVTDTPGSGTWSYALFAGYDDRGGIIRNRWSDQVTGTTRAGVVVA